MSVIDLLDAEIAALEKQIERRRAARALLADDAQPPTKAAPKTRALTQRAAKSSASAATKVCKGCGEACPRDAFLREPRCRDGLSARCRPCVARAARERRHAAERDGEPVRPPEKPEPAKPADWVDPAARIKLIRERAARGAS